MAQTLGPQAVWPNDLPLLLWTQVKTNLLFFLNDGDRSAFYLADIPGFDKVTVVLFWLGLGVVVAHVRRFHELALLLPGSASASCWPASSRLTPPTGRASSWPCPPCT